MLKQLESQCQKCPCFMQLHWPFRRRPKVSFACTQFRCEITNLFFHRSYRMSHGSSWSKMEVGNLLGRRLDCQGTEEHFLDCPSDFTGMTGQGFIECDDSQTRLLCNPGALLSKESGQISNIKGLPYVSINIEVITSSFDSRRTISCCMRPWLLSTLLHILYAWNSREPFIASL